MLKDPSKSPLDADNWAKKGPVFQGTQEVPGVGHASFTTSPDDKEWWIFYHSKKSDAPGWSRDLRLQKFTWDSTGSPVFGSPVPAGIRINKPSGEK
jgi:GH43 family beta-xylosidase